MQPEKRGVGRPPLITTEGLTDAATRLVRENGLQSLTVGQVAKELDVTTRALYHHIDGLRDLHMLVCDRVLAPVGRHNDGRTAADAIRTTLEEIRVVIDEYRGLANFVLRFGALSAETYRVVDDMIGQLTRGGFDDERAVKSTSMMLSWLASVVLREHAFEDEPVPIGLVDLDALPNIARTIGVFDSLTHRGLYQFEYAAVVEPVLRDLT